MPERASVRRRQQRPGKPSARRFVLGFAIWGGALVLAFGAAALFIAAAISGPPAWVRAVLPAGGVVLLAGAVLVGRPGIRLIHYAGAPHRAPPSARGPIARPNG